MLRRRFPCRSTPSSTSTIVVITNVLTTPQRTIFGLETTPSNFLEFSRKKDDESDKKSNQNQHHLSRYTPYHKDHLSTERFFWKKHARAMLQELKEKNLKPTSATSTMSFHNPVGELQKQHAIEYKYCRDVFNDRCHHTFQKDAFEATANFLSSSATKDAECKNFEDVIRFRIQHGAALPTEIGFALANNVVTESDVTRVRGGSEALELVKQLAPDIRMEFLLASFIKNVTSAIVHASGIGFNLGVNPACWSPIIDATQLSFDAIYDRTSDKSLVKKTSSSSSSSAFERTSSSNFFNRDRLKRVQDFSKATVVVIDLDVLDRFSQDFADDSLSLYPNYFNPIDPVLSPAALFGPPGFDSGSSSTFLSAESDPVSLNRWHHMLAVPKVSSFSLVASADYSDVVLHSLGEKMKQDPNFIVLFQHRMNHHRWAGEGVGGFPDMNVVQEVFLRSIPIHGWTMSCGTRAAFGWIEDVLVNELKVVDADDTIRVSTVGCRRTEDLHWTRTVREAEAKLSRKTIDECESMFPLCHFSAPLVSAGQVRMSDEVSFFNSIGNWFRTETKPNNNNNHTRSANINRENSNQRLDFAPARDVLRSEGGKKNFWRGLKMPVKVDRLMNDKNEDGSLKWWKNTDAAHAFNAEL